MKYNEIGTIQVQKVDALYVCNKALANIEKYRKMIETAKIVYWQKKFNREGWIYKIKSFFGRAPRKLMYPEVKLKLDELAKKWAARTSFDFNNPYCYRDHTWYKQETQILDIVSCCNSAQITPAILNIQIEVWSTIIWISNHTTESLNNRLHRDYKEFVSIC